MILGQLLPFVLAVDNGLMDASLASLPKCFFAPIDFAFKWFLSGVSVVMLHQVLLQREMLRTLGTDPLLLYFVDLHVPFQTIFCLEDLAASEDVTPKSLIILLNNL